LTRARLLLCTFGCVVVGAGFCWLGQQELGRRAELASMSKATAVVSSVGTRYADKFAKTIVHGSFASGQVVRTFSTVWGVRLAPGEIPAVGARVGIRFSPERPEQVLPDKPWDGLANVVFDFGIGCLFAVGTAVFASFAVRPEAWKRRPRKGGARR
jgi:hypothetical protein